MSAYAASERLLEQAVRVLNDGRRAEACRLLGRATQADPHSVHAWLWLAGVVEGDAERLLRSHLERGAITMRGAQRCRAVALTLADLAGRGTPLGVDLVQQALLLRGGDRTGLVAA